MPPERPEPVLELRAITKRFPGVLANDRVDFDLLPGEVHALLGENGAGKSTLMNILYGLYKADEGEIVLRGRPVAFSSPRDAIDHGIGMVHQHFMLIPVFTVTENVMLGVESTRGPLRLLDKATARDRITEISERHGLHVDPDAPVEDITVGQQQRVEILKALYRKADVLVLDEPTAVLTPQETAELFGIVRSLRDEGTSIIFISHKLNEVLELADRITVLRRGVKVGTVPAHGATERELARMMVGRDVVLEIEKPPSTPGRVLLDVRDLHVRDDRGIEKVRGVSFDVHAGEIVGIAGVDGNGQSELIEALTGLRRPVGGEIEVAGARLGHHATTADALDAGIGHIPEDRQRRGLVLDFTIAENVALHDYCKPPDSAHGWLFPARMAERARRLIRDFDVRGGGPATRAGALSGGNQQKLVVARELKGGAQPRLVVAVQPTRGLDVGATRTVHEALRAARNAGAAVIVSSLDLDELRAIADRILVVFDGRIVGETAPTATDDELGRLMLGQGVAHA